MVVFSFSMHASFRIAAKREQAWVFWLFPDSIVYIPQMFHVKPPVEGITDEKLALADTQYAILSCTGFQSVLALFTLQILVAFKVDQDGGTKSFNLTHETASYQNS